MTPASAAPGTTFPSAASSINERLKALTVRPQGLTVSALIERYMVVYDGRDSTRLQRMSAWRDMLGDFTLENLDSDVMYAARRVLAGQPALAFKGFDHAGGRIFKTKGKAQPKTPATINRYMVAMSAVYTWAIEQRLAPRGWVNPCHGIRRMKEPDGRVRFLDDDERERLFAECRVSRYPRLFALVLTAMCTGARLGELLGLRWRDVDLQGLRGQDVDLEGGIAYLASTKNGDRRTLVLLAQVVEALRPFAGDPDRYVFGAIRTRCQTPAVVDSAFRDAVARANIKNFRFHDLRHCCASYMVQNGVDLSVVADVLGQRKLDMTRRYAHLKTQTKAQAMLAALGEIK